MNNFGLCFLGSYGLFCDTQLLSVKVTDSELSNLD